MSVLNQNVDIENASGNYDRASQTEAPQGELRVHRAGSLPEAGVVLIKQPSRESQETLRRARRSYGLFCFADFLLTFLVYSIYLSMEKSDDQTYADLFGQEFVHYTFKTSFMDILILVFVRDCFLVIVYIVFKRKHWIYAGSMSFFSTIYLAVKVFVYPMGDSSETVICYFLIIAAFAMGWLSTYLVDYHFRLTRAPSRGGFMASHNNDEDANHVGNPDTQVIIPATPALSHRVNEWVINNNNNDTAKSVYESVVGDPEEFPPEIDDVERISVSVGHDDEDTRALVERRTSESRSSRGIKKPASNSYNSKGSLETSSNLDLLHQIGKDIVQFAVEQVLPDDLDWKLEDSGAYGTTIFSAETTRNSKKLRLLKMEMVLTVSPEALDQLMTQFSPERLLWDDSLSSFSLVNKISQSEFVVTYCPRSTEHSKKKSEGEEMVDLIFNSAFEDNGTIHRYGCPASKEVMNHNQGSSHSDPGSSNLALLGFTINPVASSKDKSELIYFMGFKKLGFFGASSGLKGKIEHLLVLSDSLLAKVRSKSRNNRRSGSYDGSTEYDNLG